MEPLTDKRLFENINVGDSVIYTEYKYIKGKSVPVAYRECKVTKVTDKLFYVGPFSFKRADGRAVSRYTTRRRLTPMTENARQWIAQHEERVAAERASREEYNQREDVRLAHRITRASDESLLRLPIEKLRQIVALMDSE